MIAEQRIILLWLELILGSIQIPHQWETALCVSWRLEPTDKPPVGKKPYLSLRELKKQIGCDLDMQMEPVGRILRWWNFMERHLNKKARRGSHKNHMKGPRKRTDEDDERFAQSFERLVQMALER